MTDYQFSDLKTLLEVVIRNSKKDDDWDCIMEICDALKGRRALMSRFLELVGEELMSMGPIETIKLFTLLSSLCSNVGICQDYLFKFRFLNQITRFLYKVKDNSRYDKAIRHILTVIQEWHDTYPHNEKLSAFYDVLLQHGFRYPISVKDGATLGVFNSNVFSKSLPKKKQMDEYEMNMTLRALAASKKPEDVATSNALIREMVGANDFLGEEHEGIKRDLQLTRNNLALFGEILDAKIRDQDQEPLDSDDLLVELKEGLEIVLKKMMALNEHLESNSRNDDILEVKELIEDYLKLYNDINNKKKSGVYTTKSNKNGSETTCLLDLGLDDYSSNEKKKSNTKEKSQNVVESKMTVEESLLLSQLNALGIDMSLLELKNNNNGDNDGQSIMMTQQSNDNGLNLIESGNKFSLFNNQQDSQKYGTVVSQVNNDFNYTTSKGNDFVSFDDLLVRISEERSTKGRGLFIIEVIPANQQIGKINEIKINCSVPKKFLLSPSYQSGFSLVYGEKITQEWTVSPFEGDESVRFLIEIEYIIRNTERKKCRNIIQAC